MALIVETGAVVAGAESYISVADATTYHANMGNTAWAALASDTLREGYLRQATQYMIQAYRYRWAGYRFTAGQSLDWPRSYVPIPDAVSGYGPYVAMVAPTIVPQEVKNACAELALRAISGPLLADLGQMKKRVKVGPIETEYSEFSPQVKRYPAVDGMVAIYFKQHGAMQAVRT